MAELTGLGLWLIFAGGLGANVFRWSQGVLSEVSIPQCLRRIGEDWQRRGS